VTKKALILPLN